jgi:hypothetical protein
MKYMKLYGSMAGDQHADVDRLRRRIERYRRALRRCARRRNRERETPATPGAPILRRNNKRATQAHACGGNARCTTAVAPTPAPRRPN